MVNLKQAIEKYVSSKQSIWSDRTLPVVRATLSSLAPHFRNPAENYKRLIKARRSKYTIKQYFIIAGRFEEEVFGTDNYHRFLQRNKTAFKNCYKDKTRKIQPDEFERFLKTYSENGNVNMYNLLVLMGKAGLRISEAISAKWEDIQNGYLTVIGKGSKQREIPFEKSWLKGEGSGKIIGKCAFRFLFKRDLQPFTPHDFRAYYATFISNHPELSIKDAALLLGHSSITTTSRYVRTDLNRISKVLKGGNIG